MSRLRDHRRRDPVDTTLNAPDQHAYTQSSDANAILDDPWFHQDLRDYYTERGDSRAAYMSTDDLLRRFFRDGVWRQVNTVSAIGSAIEANTVNQDQRARMARIEQASRAMPMFWQEGGRGWEGVADTAGAILTDPTNLIGGVAAGGAAKAGARTAALQGSRNAGRSGLLRGVGAAALTEGGISAGQEAVVDASLQSRDIGLGLQEEFSGSRVAGSAALGGVMGAGIGGLIGIPGGLAGSGAGLRQIERARGLGYTDDELVGLSSSEIDALTPKDPVDPVAAAQAEAEAAVAEAQDQGGDVDDAVETAEVARLLSVAVTLANEIGPDNVSAADQAMFRAILRDYESADVAEVEALIERLRALKAEADGTDVPAPEATAAEEPAPTPEPEATPEATPEPEAPVATPVRASPAARSLADERGIDLSEIEGTGHNGNITVGDVRRAAPPAQPEPEAAQPTVVIDDDRAMQILTRQSDDTSAIMDDLETIMDMVGTDNDLSPEDLREIVRAIASSDQINASPDDLLNVIDFIQRNPAPDVDDVTHGLPEGLTKTQQRKLRELIKTAREENPEITPEDAQRQAMERLRYAQDADSRIEGAIGGGDVTSDPARASLWKTAGRSRATQRIQSILRRGRPIEKGSDYTLTDGKAPKRKTLTYEEAKAKADMGQGDIQPFRYTGGGIRVIGTKDGRVKRGTEVFLDGRSGKVYLSADDLRKARGDAMPKGTQTITENQSKATRGEQLRGLMRKFKDDPNGLLRELQRRNAGRPEAAPGDTPRATQDNIKKQEELLAAQGAHESKPGMRMILRNKKTGDVRIQTARQRKAGKGFAAVAGKENPDPANWDVAYAPDELIKNSRGKDKKDIWTEVTSGASTPAEEPVTGGRVFEIGIDDQAEALSPLTAAEADAVNKMAKAYRGRLPWGDFSEGDTVSMQVILHTEQAAQSLTFAQAKRHGLSMSDVAGIVTMLNDKIAEKYPGGAKFNNTTREAGIERFQRVMTRFSAEEMAEAIKTMRSLAGTELPYFKQGMVGNGGGELSLDYRTGDASVTLSNPEQAQSFPALYTLYHELGHWAYYNILTPGDKAAFWRALSKHDSDVTGAVPWNEESPNLQRYISSTPQEFWADQFAQWVSQSGESLLQDESYWRRITRFIQSVFERFIGRPQSLVDPDLVPIFERIMPDRAKSRAYDAPATPTPLKDLPRVEPTTETGKTLRMHIGLLDMAQDQIEDAMESGSPSAMISAFESLQKQLLRIAPNDRIEMGTLRALGRQRRFIMQRVRTIDAIIRGKALEGKDFAKAYREAGQADLSIIEDPIQVATNLAKYYWLGFKGYQPENGLPGWVKDGNIAQTGVATQLDRMRAAMQGAFALYEDGLPILPPRTHTKAKTRPSSAEIVDVMAETEKAYKAMAAAGRRTKDAEVRAERTRNTPKAKRKSKAPSGKLQALERLREKSVEEIAAEFESHKGTDLGDYAAQVLGEKTRAFPERFDPAAIVADDKSLSGPDLHAAMASAINANDPALMTRYGAEIQRRGDRRILKAQRTTTVIKTELIDRDGVPSDDGIPANARPFVRDLLGRLTHRDAPAQYAMRVATYRMLNLLGKTARNSLDSVQVMSAADLKRLSGGDPSAATGVSAVLTGPDFNGLRTNMRRVAIGLTKGQSDGHEAVHEVAHALVRSGAVPGVEVDAIIDFFRTADDATKARVSQDYAGKYTDMGSAQREALIAEEYFAEKFVEYLSERITKRDFIRQTEGMSEGSLRSNIMVALDRLIEYVAYVFNGLIGNNSMRQTFRRLTFYGDMLAPETPPSVRSPGKYSFSPGTAEAAVNEIMRESPEARRRLIKDYVGEGLGWNAETGRHRVFYHGTPAGDRLNSPDAIMVPSKVGWNGGGIYITDSPAVAGEIYAEKPTATSVVRRFRDLNPDATAEDITRVEVAAIALQDTQARLSQSRLEYATLRDDLEGATPESAYEIERDMRDLTEEQADFTMYEEALREELEAAGYQPNPDVMPLVVRASKPADFRAATLYAPDDPFIWNLFDAITRANPDLDAPTLETRLATRLHTNGGDINGFDLWRALRDTLHSDPDTAHEMVNAALREQGYDSAQHTHYNTLSETNDPWGAVRVPHEALVIWDASQIKHVQAKEFNPNSDVLRENVRNDLPPRVSAAIINDVVDGEVGDWSDLPASQVGEVLEANGFNPVVTNGLVEMAQGRDLTPKSAEAGFKLSAPGFLQETSKRLSRRGFNWMADWYKKTFVERQNMFARRFYPLFNALKALPDSHGSLRRWAHASTMNVGKQQPASHKRVLAALRYGEGSRQFNALSDQEKGVFQQLRDAFKGVRDELVAAGVMVGNRQNYVPQVWDADAIRKNKQDFLDNMASYYQSERLQSGEPLAPEGDAQRFAETMYARLTEEEDGVWMGDHKPRVTGSGTDDHIDFSRVIELEKNPLMMKQLEPFLVNDLEFLLVKYYDSASRRLSNVKKMGVNNHAFYDYMKVADMGEEGIANLLSNPKVFQRSGLVRDGAYVEAFTLKRDMMVPFFGDHKAARNFAKSLIETHRVSGSAAARQMLTDAMANIPGNKIDFDRRADAIVGALDDFKGEVKPRTENDDYDFAEKALRLSMKRPLNDHDRPLRKASTAIRMFNNISLLGFTTLSSLGDVALPLVRSGSMRSWLSGMAKFAKDPEYRRMINDVGVAMENIIHERMIGMYGAHDGKASIAFFNATGLTPWTDTMRKLAGATGFESFKTMQRKAVREYKPGRPIGEQSAGYKLAHRYLSRYGLGDFLPEGAKGRIALDNDMLQNSEQVGQAIIQFADEAIFQPNANDVPMWAQTPVGAIVFQLKSFPLMMGRMGGYVVEEARKGNLKPAAYLATFGTGMGAVAVAVKDIVQGRGGEENRSHELRRRNLLKALGYDEEIHGNEDDFLGWYYEGVLQMGGLGLIGDLIHGVVDQAENGAYGKTRIASLIGGPTVGAAFDSIDVLGGALDVGNDSNAKERTAARALAQRVPILGGVRSLRENAVDAAFGPAGGRQDDAWGGSVEWGE